MKLIPLGVNGYLPINDRHSSCFLALFDDTAFLLDAGTGAARLHEAEIRALLEPYTELHVLLSHYHIDHTAGLYYAFTAWRKGPLHVHAPVCPFIQADPVEAIQRLFCPPLNSYLFEDTTMQIHPLNTESFEINGHAIRVWPQRHPGGSIGIRIDDDLAYVTDTIVMMENADHVRGVKLLLHELWLNAEDAAANEAENNRHACYDQVRAFITAARPERFMPVHLFPHYTDQQLADMTRSIGEAAGVQADVPVEKRSYTVD